MVRLLDDQLSALHEIERHVQTMEDELAVLQKTMDTAQRLRQAPGIGLLGATALAAELGDGSGWRNGRQFAACLGLCPSHRGSGGKVHIGGISKRGNPYLRTLLISGARAVVTRPHPAPWIVQLKARRPLNVVVVAVAHKLARTAWAMVAHARTYDAQWSSTAPARVAGAMRAA